jgi:hypothetical protein
MKANQQELTSHCTLAVAEYVRTSASALRTNFAAGIKMFARLLMVSTTLCPGGAEVRETESAFSAGATDGGKLVLSAGFAN